MREQTRWSNGVWNERTTRRHRQRHGGGALRRRAAQARARPLRHRGVGEEPRLAYNRVLLSSVLAGEVASSDIELKPQGWWRDRGITLRYGCRATAIDTSARTVALADGAVPAVLEARARDRLAADPARAPRHGAARRDHVPRHQRHLDHLASRRLRRPRRGDRRRAARARGRLRPRQGRRARHRAAPDGPADGAPARSRMRRAMLQRAVEAKGIEVVLECRHRARSAATTPRRGRRR